VNKCTGVKSRGAYPATHHPKHKATLQLGANPSAAEGAYVNKHCTFLNSHCTFPIHERNLNDPSNDCTYPALPLANNAAHDPVTALTIHSQCKSRSTSQRLTENSAMCQESQTKRKRKSYVSVTGGYLTQTHAEWVRIKVTLFGEGGNFEITKQRQSKLSRDNINCIDGWT